MALMALNDCNYDKMPEAQEGEERPRQDTKRAPPPPNNEKKYPFCPFTDCQTALEAGLRHAFPFTKERPERPNPDYDQKKLYSHHRSKCAINPTFRISKSPPPSHANKSKAVDVISSRYLEFTEFTEVHMLEEKGKEMALYLISEISKYSSNPIPQNLTRVKEGQRMCIKVLQETGKEILKLLKQQRFLSSELSRVSGNLTKIVVLQEFCNELRPLEDLELPKREALVLVKRIRALLSLIRKISVTREFVKRSLMAVPLYVFGGEQQSINALLNDLNRLSKFFEKKFV